MINKLLAFSIRNRLFVVAAAALLLVYGIMVILDLPVDVFPDLNRPRVTIFAEAEGLAPEEVEALVTLQIESVMNGAPGVRRVRSFSSIGLSLIFVEFEWGTDIYRDRQLVSERLQMAVGQLPEGVTPVMGPISSIMGEIMLIGMSGTSTSPMEVRTLADWIVRRRLLTIPGIAQVTVIGGDVKQYQVRVFPEKLRDFNVSLQELEAAVAAANVNTGGGFLFRGGQEYLVRNIGRTTQLEDIGNAVVTVRDGAPILVKHLADVRYGGPPFKRGDAGMDGLPAVILTVQKQPGSDTMPLTEQIDRAVEELKGSLPSDVKIDTHLFRQSNFIDASIRNVKEALRDGGVLVVAVLFLFLLNFRTSFITLTAIPLSFITTAIFFKIAGISVNTMTLGGLAVGLGELVDDAIVGVENVFRRLKENRQRPDPESSLRVVFKASSEIRNSIVYATIIVILVFMPLFALGGVEGRMFTPLGIAYVVSIVASLLVSLTVTPALCVYLLPKAKFMEKEEDSFFVRWLKHWDTKQLRITLKRPYTVMGITGALVLVAASLVLLMGREFLPSFNEGTATINLLSVPGTSLEESNRLGRIAEQLLLGVPEVVSTGRRTGRAELDEHAEGVHSTEIDVDLKESDRSRAEILADIRARVSQISGTVLNIGQPISHRIDHLLSGVRAQLAVKLFGEDLEVLRTKAGEIRDAMATVPGVVDLQVEKQVLVPQVKINIRRDQAMRYGLSMAEVAEALETAFSGRVVSQILDGQRTFDVIVQFDEQSRNDPASLQNALIDTPTGAKIPLSLVADVVQTTGPNIIAHENARRRIVIQCNTAGRDLNSVVRAIQEKVRAQVDLPTGYFVTYGGQFESEQAASRLLAILSIFSVGMIFLVLYTHFKSVRIVLQIMLNIPFALIGSVIAVFITGGVLSVATLVGFITLCGIASRNGIMMLSHYIHLVQEEGEQFNEKMIIRGSLERLVPVLMTALTTGLGLFPLMLAAGESGKEILYPLAFVVFGGLVSSTLLDMFVTPTVFFRFGRPAVEKYLKAQQESPIENEPPEVDEIRAED